ncbi:MAG: hypothetical protein EBS06_04495 [Proteobacteria bacterium]|nr:hypothetical protein [Pseudomonadota bacterium]
MELLSLVFSITAAFLLIISAIALKKARDIFIMTHIIMICNCYIIPLLLIGVEIGKFSWPSFIKIIFLIVLNLVVTNFICHAIVKRANNKREAE